MEKVDRRVRRTRRLLSQALLDLIVKKRYDDITVQDITEQADLNRATFYLHYNSKEALLVASLEDILDDLTTRMKNMLSEKSSLSNDRIALLAFQHVADYPELYKALLGENGSGHMMHRMMANFVKFNEEKLRLTLSTDDKAPLPISIVAWHIAGAFLGLISWWLENDMPHPPEYMAKIMHQLVMQGVLKSLGIE